MNNSSLESKLRKQENLRKVGSVDIFKLDEAKYIALYICAFGKKDVNPNNKVFRVYEIAQYSLMLDKIDYKEIFSCSLDFPRNKPRLLEKKEGEIKILYVDNQGLEQIFNIKSGLNSKISLNEDQKANLGIGIDMTPHEDIGYCN